MELFTYLYTFTQMQKSQHLFHNTCKSAIDFQQNLKVTSVTAEGKCPWIPFTINLIQVLSFSIQYTEVW